MTNELFQELLASVKQGAEIMKGTMTAAEAFADLYCTLPKEAGDTWLADSRLDDAMSEEVRDPWAS